MSVDLSGEITPIATAVLAVFAIVTASFAILAFRKQSREVREQGDMLKVQSEQLAEQRKINTEQCRVLELQKDELSASLEERRRESQLRRSAQASRVFISMFVESNLPPEDSETHMALLTKPEEMYKTVIARAVNTSDQPVYGASIHWHLDPGGDEESHVGTIMPGAESTSNLVVAGHLNAGREKLAEQLSGGHAPGLAG